MPLIFFFISYIYTLGGKYVGINVCLAQWMYSYYLWNLVHTLDPGSASR